MSSASLINILSSWSCRLCKIQPSQSPSHASTGRKLTSIVSASEMQASISSKLLLISKISSKLICSIIIADSSCGFLEDSMRCLIYHSSAGSKLISEDTRLICSCLLAIFWVILTTSIFFIGLIFVLRKAIYSRYKIKYNIVIYQKKEMSCIWQMCYIYYIYSIIVYLKKIFYLFLKKRLAIVYCLSIILT